MSDLLSEMREWPRNGLVRSGEAQSLLMRGAAEIERLRAELYKHTGLTYQQQMPEK